MPSERFSLSGLCRFDGCPCPRVARGYCSGHYQQMRKGQPLHKLRDDSGRGAGYVDPRSGYRYVSLGVRGKVLEHRAVMERQLGRPLRRDETVHHVNGNRLDNRIKNLELWASRHPKGQRVEDHVAEAVEVLRLYASHLLAR